MKKNILLFLTVCLSFVSCTLFKEEKDEITSFGFESASVSMKVGEVISVGFNVLPETRINDCDISYSLSSSSNIITLSSCTSSGIVITANEGGSIVVIASCEGHNAYLQVNVTASSDYSSSPYIVLPSVSYELNIGEKKSIEVSLYGGNVNDRALFEWKCLNDDICEIVAADNACIVNAKKSGFCEVEVSHPKAKYSSRILFYVLGAADNNVYITTSMNVIKMYRNSGTRQLYVNLQNSVENNNSLFIFEVAGGEDVIDIISNNNVCSITPKKTGTAQIKASHIESEISLYVNIIVVDDDSYSYIDSDDYFFVLKKGESRFTKVNLSNDEKCKYSFEIENEDICSIVQVNDCFYITGKNNGKTKVYISSDVTEYVHELYVIVEDDSRELYYISTSQNVIKTEEGSEDILLDIYLPGGNEADINGFKWVVSDSSICEIIAANGSVSDRRSSDESYNVVKAQAYVSPKKTGICEIEITHPKAEVSLIVKVIVYPKGTFTELPCYLKGSGLVKVIKGETVIHELSAVNGNSEMTFDWNIKDSSIAAVSGNELSGNITGIGSGFTELTVSCDELRYPYKASVISGTEDEINAYNILYTSNNLINLFKDETGFYEINVNGKCDSSKYSVNVDDPLVCKASMVENVLSVKGLSSGETQIIVSNSDCKNSIVFYVKVDDEISIRYPYYFNYEKFVGVVVGRTETVSVDLVGSSAEEQENIVWSCENEDVIQYDYSGNECRITARESGVSMLYVHSDKSKNDAKIIVYSAMTEEELAASVVLYCDKTNYLSYIGNDINIGLELNNLEDNRQYITWESDDISVVSIDSNYENAVLRCVSAGQCVVTARCKDALPLKIFITVKENESEIGIRDIIFPDVVEIEEGENIHIDGISSGVESSLLENICYSVSDDNIISISANSLICYVKALKEGVVYLDIELKEIGFKKKITVIVYKKGAVHLPVISLDKNYYSLDLNELINLNMSYGSVKPSDYVENGIKWVSSDPSVCEVNYSGSSCTIRGIQEGIVTVNVSGEGIYNEYSFTVCVKDKNTSISYYYFKSSKIEGIVTGQQKNIEVSLVDSFGEEVHSNLSAISYEIMDESICDVVQIDNVFCVTAKKKGQTYLVLNHVNVKESYKILIYTADSETELGNIYPISTSKDHYLISIGSSVVLSVDTVNDDYTSLLKWSCSNTSICSYQISQDKKSCKITGKKSGTVVFSVSHEYAYENVDFVVSVGESGDVSISYSILTESIIGLVKGDKYRTSVTTNIDSEYFSSLEWTSSDNQVCRVTGNGLEGEIEAVGEGECEVTVKHSSVLYSVIKVYVKNSKNEADSYYCMNIDRRYTLLGINKSVVFTPFYAKSIADSSMTEYEDVLNNNVVSIENKNGILYVKGLNEGVAKIKVSNPLTSSFYIYVEVNSLYGYIADTETGYLTSLKNVYSMNINKPLDKCSISITPVGISKSNYNTIRWSLSDSSVCSLSSNGTEAVLYPLNKGKCILNVSSIYSSNVLELLIVVDDDETTGIEYIKALNTLELKSGEYREIECEAVNVSNVDVTKFTYESDKENIIEISPFGNKVRVRGLNSGQTVLKIGYEDMYMNCVVSVNGVIDDLVYLTTEDNYTVLGIGEVNTVSVNLVGYEEINQNHFVWSYADEESSEILKINGSGQSVMVTGLKDGVANIVCTHTNPDIVNQALYPIYLSVKVSRDQTSNIKYIRSDSNVITIKEGEKATVDVELINGSESDYGYFTWSVPSECSSVVKCVGSNNQALISGLKEGVATVHVSHPDCINGTGFDFIVVVEEKPVNNLYISTDSTIINAKLSDSYKNVFVNLVGGTSEQQLLFTWEILDYESVIKNADGSSSPVVSLVSQSGESNIVKFLREGTAIVRVRNSATSYYLDIKFIISEYTSLQFDSSSVSVEENESVSIGVTSPTGKTVIYESSDDNIAVCYGTAKLCVIEGISKGTCVIKGRTTDGSFEDEIIVKVTEDMEKVSSRLTVNYNVLTLNTSDSTGTEITAHLVGSEVTEDDQDGIVWSINSSGNEYISFIGADTLNGSGNTVLVKGLKEGTDEIIVSHPKAKYSKKIYVTVEQNSAFLSLDKAFLVMEKETVGSLNAVLSGVAASEESNISWTCGNSDVLSFVTNDGLSFSATGAAVTFKTKQLCPEGVIISCSYGNLIKTCTVFIEDLPSLHIDANFDTIRTDQTKYYNINCTPSSYLDNLTFEASSSLYTVRIDSSGNLMTKLVADESEKGNDELPYGIRIPYFKVTGSGNEGVTDFVFESGNLSSKLTVTTDNSINLNYLYYKTVDKNGNEGPSNYNFNVINEDADVQKIRVYYTLFPQDIMIDKFSGSPVNVYDSSLENSFIRGEELFCSIISGKDSGGMYFDIIPSHSSNYGDIIFKASDNSKEVSRLKICLSYKNFEDNFSLSYEKSSPYNRCDIVNGLIKIGDDTPFYLKGESESELYSYKYKFIRYNAENTEVKNLSVSDYKSDTLRMNISIVDTEKSTITKREVLIDTVYDGYGILRCLYPLYYGIDGSIEKTFIVYKDKWN